MPSDDSKPRVRSKHFGQNKHKGGPSGRATLGYHLKKRLVVADPGALVELNEAKPKTNRKLTLRKID